MSHQLDPHLILERSRNLRAKELFVYLFLLRSTGFGLVTATTNDIVAFDVEDDEGMGWE